MAAPTPPRRRTTRGMAAKLAELQADAQGGNPAAPEPAAVAGTPAASEAEEPTPAKRRQDALADWRESRRRSLAPGALAKMAGDAAGAVGAMLTRPARKPLTPHNEKTGPATPGSVAKAAAADMASAGGKDSMDVLKARVDVLRRQSFMPGLQALPQTPLSGAAAAAPAGTPLAAAAAAGGAPGVPPYLATAIDCFAQADFLAKVDHALNRKIRIAKDDPEKQRKELSDNIKQLRACLKETLAKKDALRVAYSRFEHEASAQFQQMAA